MPASLENSSLTHERAIALGEIKADIKNIYLRLDHYDHLFEAVRQHIDQQQKDIRSICGTIGSITVNMESIKKDVIIVHDTLSSIKPIAEDVRTIRIFIRAFYVIMGLFAAGSAPNLLGFLKGLVMALVS